MKTLISISRKIFSYLSNAIKNIGKPKIKFGVFENEEILKQKLEEMVNTIIIVSEKIASQKVNIEEENLNNEIKVLEQFTQQNILKSRKTSYEILSEQFNELANYYSRLKKQSTVKINKTVHLFTDNRKSNNKKRLPINANVILRSKRTGIIFEWDD